jgi:glycosyltransferase involved in cell wall biosynthesis
MPELSIIVPTLEYPFIDQSVAALLSQTAPAGCFEVVLTDSRAGRWEYAVRKEAERNRDISVIYVRSECEPLRRSCQLNAGIRASSGRIVVILAGDFTAAPNFVEAHRRFHLEHPQREYVAIGSSSFVAEQAQSSLVQWLEQSGDLFGAHMEPGDAQGFFYAGNASLKREFLDQAGLFDEDFRYDAMDDFELGERLRRAGMISCFLPGSLAAHQHDEEVTLSGRKVYMGRSGESAAIFERKHPGPYGWSKSCARPPWRLELDAFLWGGVYLCRRKAEDLHRFYSARLDAAFVRGWRRGRSLHRI